MKLVDRIRRADRAILLFMRTRGHAPPIERAAIAYTAAGESGAIWIATALLGTQIDREKRRGWLISAALIPAMVAINYLVKRVVHRPRPQLQDLPPLGRVPSSHSFPSAHAATSFAFARSAPSARGPLLVAAGLMSLTRPYLGLHYPSDVVAGAAFGAAVGTAARRR